MGGQWGFIHFEACIPAMAVPGNIGWWVGIHVRFWPAWQSPVSDDLPLDRELPVPDGIPYDGRLRIGMNKDLHVIDEILIWIESRY
jgi:hypothetical protein